MAQRNPENVRSGHNALGKVNAASTIADHRSKEHNPDPLLTETEAAAYLNYRPRTLASWRRTGRGPRFVAVSRTSRRYRRSDLDAFIASKLRRSTSDDGEGEV